MILAHVITSSLAHADLWAFVIVVAALVGAAVYAFREYRRSRQWGEEQSRRGIGTPDDD